MDRRTRHYCPDTFTMPPGPRPQVSKEMMSTPAQALLMVEHSTRQLTDQYVLDGLLDPECLQESRDEPAALSTGPPMEAIMQQRAPLLRHAQPTQGRQG